MIAEPFRSQNRLHSAKAITRRSILGGFPALAAAARRRMMFSDTSRLGRPFAKDPSVIRFQGRYLIYYSIPPFGDKRPDDGWAIGIAASRNLVDWEKTGELLPSSDYERRGLCAPNCIVLDGQVHMFYQTYGQGPKDAICHAVSPDGIRFRRNDTNPVFRPAGAWNCGRAIDAEIVEHGGDVLLYSATRDPGFKIQMLVAASAGRQSGFVRDAWRQLGDGPMLKPELPWERQCIEAPAVAKHGGRLFLFYAGAYNNEPQQIGCAVSMDGVHYTRLSDRPFLSNGGPGEWNSSESGHPGILSDENGRTYLFFQGNSDGGRTYYLSFVEIGWKHDRPYVRT